MRKKKPPTSNVSDSDTIQTSFLKLYEIVSLLRGPEGCPWDREQTPRTLRSSLIEEAYECVNAIDENDTGNLSEELGDVLLIVLLLTRMNEEANTFRLVDVLETISAKLIRRHPHVFEKKASASIPEIIRNWDYIKEHIEGKKKKESILADTGGSRPPLEKSFLLQKKAAKAGFDWKRPKEIIPKLKEEIRELEDALENRDTIATEEEIGDLLFTVVNLSRHFNTDPALALERTNRKFIKRFQLIEEELRKRDIPLDKASLPLLDDLWNKVKQEEKKR